MKPLDRTTEAVQPVIPALRITNSRVAKAFYTAFLGFHVDWEHCFDPDTAVFMQVSRDGLAIYLTEHADDAPIGGLVHIFVAESHAGTPTSAEGERRSRNRRTSASRATGCSPCSTPTAIRSASAPAQPSEAKPVIRLAAGYWPGL